MTFGMIAGTMMACPETDELANRFRSALKGTGHWQILKGRLHFYGATGKPLAVFERRETGSPAAPGSLEGTAWRLVRFQGGDDKALMPDDPAKYTIEFAAGGQLAARLAATRVPFQPPLRCVQPRVPTPSMSRLSSSAGQGVGFV